MNRRHNGTCLALWLVLSLVFVTVEATAQGRNAAFDRERWEVQGNSAVIKYDLVGPPDMTFDVTVTLRREGQRGFSFVPRSVTGNIGAGQTVGTAKEIRWDYKTDFPEGLNGSDYWFELSGVGTEPGGGLQWWHYAAAGAGVAVAAVVFLGGKSGTTPPPDQNLPDAPRIRPPND